MVRALCRRRKQTPLIAFCNKKAEIFQTKDSGFLFWPSFPLLHTPTPVIPPLPHFSQLQYLRFASFFLFCPNAFHPVPCPSSFYSNTPHSTPLFLFSTFLYSNPFHFSFSLFQYIPFFPSFSSPVFQLLPLRPIFFFSLKSKHTSQKFSFPKTEKLKNPPIFPNITLSLPPFHQKTIPPLHAKIPLIPCPFRAFSPSLFPTKKG